MPSRLARAPRRFRGPSFLLSVVGLCLAAAPSFAQITALEGTTEVVEEEEPYPTVVWGLSFFGGLHTYDMKDLNRSLEVVNAELASQGSRGVQYGFFEDGGSLGGGVRLIVNERIVVMADWERLMTSHSVGGIRAKSDVETPVDALLLTVGWDFLKSRDTRFGFAAGLGRYDSKANQRMVETSIDDEETVLGDLEFSGNTIGQHYGAFFEAKLTERVFVNVFAGYRNAKIDDIEITGYEDLVEPSPDVFVAIPIVECTGNCPEDPDYDPSTPSEVSLKGEEDALDWSGFMGRLGLTFYWNVPTF